MIFLILAVLPAVILLAYIYNKDRVEKEPPGLLFRLFLLGALSTVPAIFFELCGQSIFGAFFNEKSLIYIICENFLVVALAEEGCKYFFLKRTTWKAPAFNYTFDAVVYAVVISLHQEGDILAGENSVSVDFIEFIARFEPVGGAGGIF